MATTATTRLSEALYAPPRTSNGVSESPRRGRHARVSDGLSWDVLAASPRRTVIGRNADERSYPRSAERRRRCVSKYGPTLAEVTSSLVVFFRDQIWSG